jgi:hypothetical protein
VSASNLEDRAAIHDLFTRYCCALDNGEIEVVVDCFTAGEGADFVAAADVDDRALEDRVYRTPLQW